MDNRSDAKIETRTVSLPAEQSRYIDHTVASGRYASVSDVVEAGLIALQEREVAVDLWLREDVLPVYDAMQADPGLGMTADAVIRQLQAHHAARINKASRGD
ncbi:ribbon-helix-helix domain-containing protein [Acidisoma silvae]|uniref:Type II toxin-antitoxin system ParD family antitoxin n=1 Tax=Acidisoma silvae TaxID=2802396 RepID=A0A963YUC3_9PROT|nr:type II toxin-antitoxin system ParD family antitoxin [Acidisoma silvae]MCB8877225.1 type II toxin-antitoxin system ParD family antitoxin [Acidisoma silvae]